MLTCSHCDSELRTPMNAILAFTKFLKRSELNPDQVESVDMIHSSGKQLVGVLDEILLFSKSEAGSLQLEEIKFSPQKIVEHALEMITTKYLDENASSADELNHAEFICDVRSGLPEMVIGDSNKLMQVFLNFLSNAAKFGRSGSTVVASATPYNVPYDIAHHHGDGDGDGDGCRQSRSRSEDKVWIRFGVADQGIGIESSKLAKLFHEFHQADNTISRQYGGTGLGLASKKYIPPTMGLMGMGWG